MSISHSMPWLSTTESTNSLKSSSNKGLNSVIYPIFSKYLDYVDDPYWKQILESCARGKFLKGIAINGNIIFHKPTNKSINMENNFQFIQQFIDFIKANMKLRSKMDLDRERDLEREKYLNIDNTIIDWSKVKSKHNKHLLIVEFVSKLENIYKLSETEKGQLSTLINIYGDEISKNIVVKDNNIFEISGLMWDPKNRIFSLPNIQKNENFWHQSSLVNVIYIEENIPIELSAGDTIKEWNKFLKNFNKSVKKITSPKEDSIAVASTKFSSDSYKVESSNS